MESGDHIIILATSHKISSKGPWMAEPTTDNGEWVYAMNWHNKKVYNSFGEWVYTVHWHNTKLHKSFD